MVTFNLIEENSDSLFYCYYPEGLNDKRPGKIIVDRIANKIEIAELAEEDFERVITPEELNELGKVINQMKREQGDSDFVEPAVKPIHSTFYGDHAVNEIVKQLRSGITPRQGKRVWY